MNLFKNSQRVQYANHGSSYSESQPTVKASERKEITCNQARKQKCNYRAKQSIHACSFESRKHIAIVMQITLIVAGSVLVWILSSVKIKKRAADSI